MNNSNINLNGVFLDTQTAKTVLTFAAIGVVAVGYAGYKVGKALESKIVEFVEEKIIK